MTGSRRLADRAGAHAVVLGFHRITSGNTPYPDQAPGLTCRSSDMMKILEWVSNLYRFVEAEEFLPLLREGGERIALVTFDDAFPDFAEIAWPILKPYGIPVLLFASTSAEPLWQNRVCRAVERTPRSEVRFEGKNYRLCSVRERRRLRRDVRVHMVRDPGPGRSEILSRLFSVLEHDGAAEEPRLGLVDLKRLAEDGVRIGCHTVTHPILKGLDPGRLEEEIARDKANREEYFEREIAYFAYPFGDRESVDEAAVASVRKAGFVLAFSTVLGLARPDTDPAMIPRLMVDWDDRLDGWIGRKWRPCLSGMRR